MNQVSYFWIDSTDNCCNVVVVDFRRTRNTSRQGIEITIALGVIILILILDRRADSRIHEMIHEQHLLINKMHQKIDQQNELIKNIQKYPQVMKTM
jgi:Zn-finger domain-containing protein